MKRYLPTLLTLALALAATPAVAPDSQPTPAPVASPAPDNLQEAYFAGGCF